MSDNETPQGGQGNVYDAQFANRIANISKGGGGGGGGKKAGIGSRGGWGATGGIAFVIFILLRVVLAGSRGCSDRDRPSYSYTPPPQVQFQMPNEDELNHGFVDWRKGILEKRAHLSADDIVFAPGLCREIVEDNKKPGPTPGKRLYERLDGKGQILVRRLAGAREAKPAEVSALAEQLDGVLGSRDFYDVTTFRAVKRPELESDLAKLWDGLRKPATEAEVRRLNREALEAAYPTQILPHSRSFGGRGVGLPDLRRLLQEEHEKALQKKGD
jgi:hypothetical protein